MTIVYEYTLLSENVARAIREGEFLPVHIVQVNDIPCLAGVNLASDATENDVSVLYLPDVVRDRTGIISVYGSNLEAVIRNAEEYLSGDVARYSTVLNREITAPGYTIKARYVDVVNARVVRGQYADGSLSLSVVSDDPQDLTISINLSAYGLTAPESHIFVKDYSEHEGLPQALIEAGIAEPVERVEFGPFDGAAWLMKVVAK